MTLINKAAGVADPISLSDVTRGYVATTQSANGFHQPGHPDGSEYTNNDAKLLVWLLLRAVLLRTTMPYQGVWNYLIAEYGSLSQQQRNVSYVKKAAQAFVRSLAAYPANKNGVADRNAFTFGHDAQLNFNTSFTGKDKLNFRLRANTIYSFAKRVNAPFADLAFDGSLPENWKGKKTVFVDKLYYKFPVGSGARCPWVHGAPQSSFTTRGSMYNKDSCLSSSTPLLVSTPL